MRSAQGDRLPQATIPRLQHFIDQVSRRLDERPDEPAIRRDVGALLADLVAHDDWLPASHAQPGADRYRQYLLHRDPQARFSVVSFVWGPGQATPIHDHTVWGLIGVLRGAEVSQGYRFASPSKLVPAGAPVRLAQGVVDAVSPSVGDIHRVSNAFDDRTSISIHVYGADIGAVERSVYTEDGQRRLFISGYSPLPTA
jgi:predicted metal-dependent enzyme (double-stranded beta helix superfamily)